MDRAKIAVLISGAGTNMAALVYASRIADCPYEVVLVASNDPAAAGLALACQVNAKDPSAGYVDFNSFLPNPDGQLLPGKRQFGFSTSALPAALPAAPGGEVRVDFFAPAGEAYPLRQVQVRDTQVREGIDHGRGEGGDGADVGRFGHPFGAQRRLLVSP